MDEGRDLLLLEVRSDGVRVVDRDLKNLGKTGAGAIDTFGRLQSVLGGLITARTIMNTVRLADSYATMLNRIRVVTNSHKELQTAMSGVAKITRDTRSSLEGNMSMYARIAINTRDYGLQQKDVLDFTRQLNQAIILSGVTAREAEWGMVQFSQGLASGALRGDELRSVLEQLPVVADVIAKHFGATRGQLRQLGFEGKITTDSMIQAFRMASNDLEERFAKTIPTLNQAMTVLKGSWQAFIGEIDQSFGITQTMARTVLLLSDNMDVFGRAALAVGSILSGVLIVNMLRATKVMQGLVWIVRLNPYVAAFTLAGVAAFTLAGRIESILYPVNEVGDAIASAGEKLDKWAPSIASARKEFGSFADGAVGAATSIEDAARRAIESVEGMARPRDTEAADVPMFLSPMSDADMKRLVSGQMDAWRSATKDIDLGLMTSEAYADDLVDTFVRMRQEVQQPINIGPLRSSFQVITDDAIRAAESAKTARDAIDQFFVPPLTPDQTKLSMAIRKPLDDLRQMSSDLVVLLNRPYEQGGITLEQYNRQLDLLKEKATTNADALRFMVEEGMITPLEGVRAKLVLVNQELQNNIDSTSGFKRGINDVFLTLTDHATQAQRTVTNAFSSMEDAVVGLATTGKVNFKAMAESMLADLTRLIFRMLMLKAIEGASGGWGGVFSSLANTASSSGSGGGGGGAPEGRAEGGGVYANTPVIVGERGPELFVPNQPGTVIPNDEVSQGGGGGGVVIINVSSMEEAYAAMESTRGARIIINQTGKGGKR